MAQHLTFNEYLTEKPLTPQQRMKRARVMKRLAPKIQMKKKLAMKKKAPIEKIKKRAEKKAKDIVRKKFSDGDYGQMSFAQKIQIDKKVEKKKALVKKIAKKLVPKLKKAEADRLTKLRGKKSEATASQTKENKMNIKDKETQSVAEKVKEVTDLKIAEGRMKELHGYIDDGLSAEEIIKKMKLKKTPDMIKFINGLMKEGNAFGKAVVDAKKAGKKTFKFNGKDYKVEGDEVNEIDFHPTKKKLVGAGVKESTDLDEKAPTMSQGMSRALDQMYQLAGSLAKGSRLNKGVNKDLGGNYNSDFGKMEKAMGVVTGIFGDIIQDYKTFKEETEIQEGLLSKNDKTSGYAGRGQFELKKHIMPLVKKNKALKDIYFDGPDLVGDTKKGKQTTIAKGVLTDKKMTVADLEKAIKSFKEETEIEEAVKPEVFVKGGDTKVTKREIDKILSKIFLNNKLAKQVEASKAYKDGFGGKVKKNPYKKDTADFHLFILGQQSAEAS